VVVTWFASSQGVPASCKRTMDGVDLVAAVAVGLHYLSHREDNCSDGSPLVRRGTSFGYFGWLIESHSTTSSSFFFGFYCKRIQIGFFVVSLSPAMLKVFEALKMFFSSSAKFTACLAESKFDNVAFGGFRDR
jgi:hypothetical protein